MFASERKFERHARRCGVRFLRRGWPDRLVVQPDGSIAFVEVKGHDRLSPSQRAMLGALERGGLSVSVWDSVREVYVRWQDFSPVPASQAVSGLVQMGFSIPMSLKISLQQRAAESRKKLSQVVVADLELASHLRKALWSKRAAIRQFAIEQGLDPETQMGEVYVRLIEIALAARNAKK